jgi:hypothetical protein
VGRFGRAAEREPLTSTAVLQAQKFPSFDLDGPIQTAVVPPEIKGRLFYNDAMDGFNHERVHETFQVARTRILSNPHNPAPPAVYAGRIHSEYVVAYY